MPFKKGVCTNPKGRPKGALSRRVKLVRLLEPHAEPLIQKCIELALAGDPNALRLCIERLVPKARCEPVSVDLPEKFTPADIEAIKTDVIRAIFGGNLHVDEGEKLLTLIQNHLKQHSSIEAVEMPDDPIEASKVYQQMMGDA